MMQDNSALPNRKPQRPSRLIRPPSPGPGRTVVAFSAAVVLAAALGSVTIAEAQGFRWPWEVETRPPVPEAPVYQDRGPGRQPPPGAQPPPMVREGPDGAWSARSPICLDLERRLVQESQRGGSFRDRLPQLEVELRDADLALRKGEQQLERLDCYEFFLFSKSLRRTPQCVQRAREVDELRRRLATLEAERQSMTSQSSQSYQDEIIRELARNECGANYAQEARRRDRSPFAALWQDGGESSGYANQYRALPFATYRTLCVRLCDGYYFPVSFSTLPNHFQRDADLCQSRCAAPAELYYHQNPGEGVEQAMSALSNQPYAQLQSAFRYRKEYVSGCSCNVAEFQADAAAQQGAATPRSAWEPTDVRRTGASPSGGPATAPAGPASGPSASPLPGSQPR